MAHVATITIDHTKVAADLTDFPILIVCNGDAGWDELYALATEGGGDIRIFKSGGATELPREIVSFTVAGENGEIHVKYSGTLSGTVDTDIEIHCDGVAADYAVGATYGRNAVWSGYEGVWHLQDLTGATGSYNLTNVGTSSRTGKIGNGRDFGGATKDDHLWTADDAPTTLNTWTASVWVYPDILGDYEGIFSKLSTTRDGAGGNQDFILICHNDGRIGANPGGSWVFSSAASITAGSWHHFQWVRSGSQIAYYVNGVARGTSSYSNSNTAGFKFFIGSWNSTVNDYRLNGAMDSVRFIQSALSANWITTEYNNQNDVGTFYSVVVAADPVTNINASTLPTSLATLTPTIAGASNVTPGTLSLNLSLIGSTTTGASNYNTSVLETTLAIVPPTIFLELVTNIDASVLTLTTAILEPLATGASNVDVDSLGVTLGTLEPTVIGGSNVFPEILGLEMSVLYPSTIGGLWRRKGRNPGEWTRLPVNND